MAETYRPFDEAIPNEEFECDPVGKLELAERLGVAARSVHMMFHRGSLPEPDWEQINGYRAWNWATILWWAGETGRLRTPELVAQYREMFGMTEPDLEAGRKVGGHWHRKDPHPDKPKVPS